MILKQLLQLSLDGRYFSDEAILRMGPRPARQGRLTIRLRPDDAMRLQARADVRAMPAATYASVALRAHLKNVAPLPKVEQVLLREALREVSQFREEMRRHAYQPNSAQVVAFVKVCQALGDHIHALFDKNLRHWQ